MRNVERKSSIYDLKVIIVFAAFFFSHFIKTLEVVAPIDNYHNRNSKMVLQLLQLEPSHGPVRTGG